MRVIERGVLINIALMSINAPILGVSTYISGTKNGFSIHARWICDTGIILVSRISIQLYEVA